MTLPCAFDKDFATKMKKNDIVDWDDIEIT